MNRLAIYLSGLYDRARVALYLRRQDVPNGSTKLQALYQALDDADDTLQAASRAIRAGDHSEALHLLALGRSSIADHIEELKGLL